MTMTPSSGSFRKFPYDFYITPECLNKLNAYAKAALEHSGSEIGGLARLNIQRETGNIFVTDIFMFPQVASAANFTFEAEDLNTFTRQMIKAGRADELPEWRSIVHSHPVGVQPNMSPLDRQMIQDFAHEQDAFSLIITASREGNSRNLKMHYCCNMYGQRHIISDIEVKIGMSAERAELCDQTTRYLYNKLGGKNSLNDADKDQLEGLVTEFMAAKVPSMFQKQLVVLNRDVKAHVEALITRPKTQVVKVNSKNGVKEEVQKIIDEASQQSMNLEGLIGGPLTPAEQEYLGAADEEPIKDLLLKLRSQVNEHWMIGFERTDPNNDELEISNKQAKRHQKQWQKKVIEINGIINMVSDVGLHDWVQINEEVFDKYKLDPEQFDKNTVYEVTDFMIGEAGISFEINGVNFWEAELTLEQSFEDYMEECMEERKRIALEEQQGIPAS